MSPRPALVLLAVLATCGAAACGAATPVEARGAPPADGRSAPVAALRFASAAEGKALLAAEDDFTRELSAFDRSLRLKRTDAVGDVEYRRFVGEQAADFTSEEKSAWAPALEELRHAIEGLELGLPPVVLVVKTTGREELDAAYTRQNAIMLPAAMVTGMKSEARVALLAHELMHVSSRASKELRDRRYALLAFAPMAPIAPPRELESRRLTNPDAHGLDHYVRVTANDGVEHSVVPFLSCDAPLAKAIVGATWIEALRVVLIEVDPAKGAPMVDATGRTRTFDAAATDWTHRLGKNTGYVIHPEEVLADNFALVVKRRLGRAEKVEHPELLDALEASMRRH